MPGQPGNSNAIRVGTKSVFTTGRWPKGASYVAKLGWRLRRLLESEVYEAHGEISVSNQATIQTCCRHEIRALLVQRWLRESPDMEIEAKVRMLAEIGKASDARDRCLKALEIDRRRTSDAFSRIIEQAENLPEATAGPPHGDADGAEAQEDTNSTDAADGNSGNADGTHHRNGKKT
jgi:hypothetical protein